MATEVNWQSLFPERNPEEIALWSEVYDILVEETGACSDESNRSEFIHHQPTMEYRIPGSNLGGGKFWINDGFYVSCYSELHNIKAEMVIAKTNARLAPLARVYYSRWANKTLE